MPANSRWYLIRGLKGYKCFVQTDQIYGRTFGANGSKFTAKYRGSGSPKSGAARGFTWVPKRILRFQNRLRISWRSGGLSSYQESLCSLELANLKLHNYQYRKTIQDESTSLFFRLSKYTAVLYHKYLIKHHSSNCFLHYICRTALQPLFCTPFP